MKTKAATYIALGSLLVAVASLIFAVYSWKYFQAKNTIEKKTELLGKISELKTNSAKLRARFLTLKNQRLAEPVPTHIKRNGKCVPAPEFANYIRSSRTEIIKTYDELLKKVEEYLSYAKQLQEKYGNYDIDVPDHEIQKTIAEVTDKIAILKALDKEPPKLEPIIYEPISSQSTVGKGTAIPCDENQARNKK